MNPKRLLLLAPLVLGSALPATAQGPRFSRADTLRGSVTPERAWWDVVHYDLSVSVNPSDSSIVGSNTIRYEVTGPSGEMQIDLMAPLRVDSVVQEGVRLPARLDGDVFFVRPEAPQDPNTRHELTVYYHGRPKVAVTPPWDGGFVWSRDPQRNPWHLAQARAQFAQVKPMLACFEGWLGPYPFYEDGYKLVEAPYLGMEHQSAVAYGNRFQNGYLGFDLSGTGRGLSWDYVIIHESAHEWFGNSITTADVADLWVHEGFADYAESLYVECTQGKAAGAEYVVGSRTRIRNDRPVIGPYGVHQEGSDDMYFKGANILHTLRQIVDDDGRWRSMLRGMNEAFYHETVTSREVEEYLGRTAGRDLGRFFDHYLRSRQVPVLEFSLDGDTVSYRWRAEVEGFDMPVRVTVSRDRSVWISPETDEWKTLPLELDDPSDFRVDENFYVRMAEVRE